MSTSRSAAVVGRHPARARRCGVQRLVAGEERQQLERGTAIVQVPLQRGVARQHLDCHLFGGLGFLEVVLGDGALRVRRVEHCAGDDQDGGKGGKKSSHIRVIGGCPTT